MSYAVLSRSISVSASPSRLRGTTPSLTRYSGLSRPTAENALFRPFQMRKRSASSCATRIAYAPEASMIGLSRRNSSSTCCASPSSSTISSAAASWG